MNKSRRSYMNRKSVVLCCVVLALVLAPAVFAQESKISEASYGLFTNEVDDYMDVNSWTNVDFNKAFGFISGSRVALRTSTPVSGGFAGGVATKLKGLYLGFFVDGQYWDGTAVDHYNDNDRADPVYTASGSDFPVEFDNSWAVLIGGGFGGIKVFLDFEETSHDYDENKDTKEKYTADTGRVSFGAEWGKNIEKNGKTWEPHVGLGYSFGLDGYTYELKGDKTIEEGGRDFLGISGGSNLPLFENAYAGADLDIVFGFQRNPYSDKDNTVRFKGYDWGFTPSAYIGREFTITEQLSLAVEFDFEFGFWFWQEKYSKDWIGLTNSNTKYSAFYIEPAAEAALQYKFKKPFMLVAGIEYASEAARFGINRFIDKTSFPRQDGFYIVETVDPEGNSKTITQDFNALVMALSLGGAWTPLPAFTLEAKFEVLPFYHSGTGGGTPSFADGTYKTTMNVTNMDFEFSLLASLKF